MATWTTHLNLVLVEICEKQGTMTKSFDTVAWVLNNYNSEHFGVRNESFSAVECKLQLKNLHCQFSVNQAHDGSLGIVRKKLKEQRLIELASEIEEVVDEYQKVKADLESALTGTLTQSELLDLATRLNSSSVVKNESFEDDDEINVSGLIQELVASDDSEFLDCSLSAADDSVTIEDPDGQPSAFDSTTDTRQTKASTTKPDFDDKKYKQWKKSTLLLWKSIANHKWANIFMQPVTDDIAPNYSRVVKYPVDLNSIKRKIENGALTSNEEFARDILLMFQNAFVYNNVDHKVYQCASEMQTDCLVLLQQNFGSNFFRNYQLPVVEVRQQRTRTSKFSDASFKWVDDTMFRPEGIEDTGPGRAAAMRNFSRIRDRLFYALFHKLSHTYAKVFPPCIRRCFEFIVFAEALCAIFFLIYMHTIFSNAPVGCLESVHNNWPKHDGILRIEVMTNLSHSPVLMSAQYRGYPDLNTSDKMFLQDFKFQVVEPGLLFVDNSTECPNIPLKQYKERRKSNIGLMDILIDNSIMFEQGENYSAVKILEPELIFEYALEYGFLRLSDKVRRKLGIKVTTLRIDPDKDACFGSGLARYIRREVIGVEDLLRNSFKVLAFEEDKKQGYLRNVKTDEHFKFISVHATKSSYIAAAFVMVLFTLSISMLLRYSHHQIFIFIIDVLQMLELNIGMVFPAAPSLTVILALVGIEAIMSEFFSDSTTAFYIIIIVWVADQYEAICCHTAITKRYWLRFFYLYHFAFYAYHYRFNGQYSGLALVASWLLIQHSMMYFFHHYELPAVLHRTAMLQNQHRRFQNNQQTEGARWTNVDREPTALPSGNVTSLDLSRNSTLHVNRQLIANSSSNSYNPHSNTQLPDNINDPTSLEYIEHLLEELIPARNGIVSNAQHQSLTASHSASQHRPATSVGTSQINYSATGRNVSSSGNSSSASNRSWQTISIADQNEESVYPGSQTLLHSGVERNSDVTPSGSDIPNRNESRLLAPIGLNVALYPFQHLIVSLLIRLLNFIQSGSPVRNHHHSSAQNPEGSSNLSIDQTTTYPDPTSSLDRIINADYSNLNGTVQPRVQRNNNDNICRRMTNLNPRLFLQNEAAADGNGLLGLSGTVTRAPQHRRTRSANNIPQYHADEDDLQFSGNG